MPNGLWQGLTERLAAISVGELNRIELTWLVLPRRHIALLERRRSDMIVSRVRLVSGLFALLTPVWIVVDLLAFPTELWSGLAVGRVIATIAFTAVVVYFRSPRYQMRDTYLALALMFAIPTLFYIFSYQMLSRFELRDMQAAIAAGYGFLPFVMIAGLSIFPLTLLESLLFAAPVLGAKVLAAALNWTALDWPSFAGALWLLMLITAVSSLASVSQLAFIIVLVRQAIRDALTGCFSRQSGEDLLELQFNISERGGTPLAVAFLDIDHFKRVNDEYGHDVGDMTLVNAAQQISSRLRTGDILVRWGGEEFVIVMPNTDAGHALIGLERVRATGLGMRPERLPLTASIGVAERIADRAADWRALVESADARMYRAKEGGRDRIVSCDLSLN